MRQCTKNANRDNTSANPRAGAHTYTHRVKYETPQLQLERSGARGHCSSDSCFVCHQLHLTIRIVQRHCGKEGHRMHENELVVCSCSSAG